MRSRVVSSRSENRKWRRHLLNFNSLYLNTKGLFFAGIRARQRRPTCMWCLSHGSAVPLRNLFSSARPSSFAVLANIYLIDRCRVRIYPSRPLCCIANTRRVGPPPAPFPYQRATEVARCGSCQRDGRPPGPSGLVVLIQSLLRAGTRRAENIVVRQNPDIK
jgi:hypothetical protein